MAKKQITYEQAMTRLEELISGMERNEWSIEELSDALKEAQELIQLCKNKLYKTDKQVKKLLNEE